MKILSEKVVAGVLEAEKKAVKVKKRWRGREKVTSRQLRRADLTRLPSPGTEVPLGGAAILGQPCGRE